MDLSERVARRQTGSGDDQLLVDRAVLSPAVHLPEPVGRAPELERLLDAVDPIFDGRLPPEIAVAGPQGAGKSALVTALFGALSDRLGRGDAPATSTRGGPRRWFATVDCRRVGTPFRFYRAILAQLDGEDVPEHGVGTAALRERLVDRLGQPGRWALLAVDHLEEARELDVAALRSLLEPIADDVSVVWIGREPPTVRGRAGAVVRIEPYRHHALTDVLSRRCSRGLATGAVEHDVLREIAARAEGDAHDALAVALGAALLADHDGADALERDATRVARSAVPEATVHLDAVLALPETRRRVLTSLLGLAPEPTVAEAADAIAARTELSTGTVRRFCYELAEAGILERRTGDAAAPGRDPSHLRPAFPWLAYAGLAEGIEVIDVVDRLDR